MALEQTAVLLGSTPGSGRSLTTTATCPRTADQETFRAKGLKIQSSAETRGAPQGEFTESAVPTVPQKLDGKALLAGPVGLSDRAVSLRQAHCEAQLDVCLLEDSCVPEHQKLRHVLAWAESFIRTGTASGHGQPMGNTKGQHGRTVTATDNSHVTPTSCGEVPQPTGQVTQFSQPHHSPRPRPYLKAPLQPHPSTAERVTESMTQGGTEDLPGVGVGCVPPSTCPSLDSPPRLSIYEKYLMCVAHLNSCKTQACGQSQLSAGRVWEETSLAPREGARNETGVVLGEGDRRETCRVQSGHADSGKGRCLSSRAAAQWSGSDHGHPSHLPDLVVENSVKVEERVSVEENHHSTGNCTNIELPVTAPVNHSTTELPLPAPVNHSTTELPLPAPVNQATTELPVTAPVNHMITELPVRQKRERRDTETGSDPKGRKAAGVRPRRTASLTAGQPRRKRFWETSSILWSSYPQGALLPRSKPPGQAVKGGPCRPSVTDTPQRENLTGSESRLLKTSDHPETQQKHAIGHIVPAPWLSLPDELWIYILKLLAPSDLSHVAQTCRRLCRLANDRTLWVVVRIENSTCLNDDWLSSIGRRGPHSITLYRCTDGSVTQEGLAELFAQCSSSLKEVRIMSCSGPGLHGDRLLVPCSQHCTHLTDVDVSWTGATDTGITAIASTSTRLQSVAVNGCQMVTDRALNILTKRHGKSLHRLEVFGCQNLSSACLSVMATNCPNLRVLNIGKLPKVTERCLTHIISTFKQLMLLNLAGLPMVRDGTVHQIVRQCPDLQNLTLSCCPHVTDISLREISTYAPSIRYLDVSGCQSVTDSGVRAIAMACLHLQYIDLSSTRTSNKGVCLLASYCYRHLHTVKLSFCYICQDALRKLCRHCKGLRLLHLYGACDFHNVQEFRQINHNLEAKCDLNCTPEQQSCRPGGVLKPRCDHRQ